MNVKVNIQGEGTVNGDGSYNVGDTAVLTATPDDITHFGYFQRLEYKDGEIIKGEKITSSRLSLVIDSDVDIHLDAYFYIDMRTYLLADFEFDIKNAALVKIADRRKFRLTDDSNDVSEKDKALATADLLLVVCNSPSMIQGKTEKAGNWSESQGSKTLSITDKKEMRARAYTIYDDWGEKQKTGTTVKIGRRLW